MSSTPIQPSQRRRTSVVSDGPSSFRAPAAQALSGWGASYLGSGEVAFSLFNKAAIAAKAGKQVARATAGSSLSDYRQAEDLSTFWYAPATLETAYWKAAYWLAVASRLGGSGLAASAAAAFAKGSNPIALAGAALTTDSSTILLDAGQKVQSVAGSNKQLQAIAKILGVHATQVAGAQQRAWEQSGPGIVVDALAKTGGQIAGTEKRPWYFWPAVVGIPLALFLIYVQATGAAIRARSFAADVKRKATAGYEAAMKTNRRRSKRSRRR